MIEEIQELSDAAGNGAVHPALAAAILALHERVSLLELAPEPVADDPEVKATKSRKGGE